MQQKLTLLQRILSDTPSFFKKIQVFALGLAGLGGTLATIQGIPQSLTTTLISAGTAVAAMAQFAVKFDDEDSSAAIATETK
jgi:phosphate/sulfate permease